MSGNAYKVLGFLAWRGGTWYLRKRFGLAKRIGGGAVAALALAGGAAAVLQRRNGSGSAA